MRNAITERKSYKNAQVLKVMKYKLKMQLYCVGIQEVSDENYRYSKQHETEFGQAIL